MVARPPLASTARVELLYGYAPELGGHEAANIMYVSGDGLTGLTTAELNTVAEGITTAWIGNLAQCVVPSLTIASTTVTMIDGTEAQGTWTSGSPGTYPEGASNPPNTAAVISWKIAAAYRGGHPRSYLPGTPVAGLVGEGSNEFSAAYAGLVASSGDSFIGQVNEVAAGDGVITLGTVSYVRGKVERDPPVFYPFLSGAARCNTRLGTQRRRLGKLSVGTYLI